MSKGLNFPAAAKLQSSMKILIWDKLRRISMVKHIILWQLKEMDEEEKQTAKKGDQAGLESLQGKIPGTFCRFMCRRKVCHRQMQISC